MLWSAEIRAVLHRARTAAVRTGTGRTNLSRATLLRRRREAVLEIAEFTRIEAARTLRPTHAGSLPGVHAWSHRHRALRTTAALGSALLPRRTRTSPSEVRPRALGKAVRPVAGLRPAMFGPAILSLPTFARRRTLRAFATEITALLARAARSAIAIAPIFRTRAFRTTPLIAIAARIAVRTRTTIALGTRSFTTRPISASLATRPLVAAAFRLHSRLARSATLAVTPLWPPALIATVGALAVALRPDFIGRDPTVIVAVELLERVAGVRDFFLVDHAVVVGIQRREDSVRGTLAPSAVRAVVARSTFARRWAGWTLWRIGWLIFLGEKRTRRKRERHRGGKAEVSFHNVFDCCQWRVPPRDATRISSVITPRRRAFACLNETFTREGSAPTARPRTRLWWLRARPYFTPVASTV
jgi:hypothetical protein